MSRLIAAPGLKVNRLMQNLSPDIWPGDSPASKAGREQKTQFTDSYLECQGKRPQINDDVTLCFKRVGPIDAEKIKEAGGEDSTSLFIFRIY